MPVFHSTDILGDLKVTGKSYVSDQIKSSVPTGTAPFEVASTTKVTNLNADLLDGMNTASSNTASTVVARDSSGNFSAGTITANLTGTASGNLTSSSTLDASKLSGTIPSAVLGNSTHYIGTTAVTLNRASATLALTGVTNTNWDSAYTHSTTTTGAVHGATTVGNSFFRLTNPSAITFPRINADNTVTALSASDFRTAIGAGTGNGTVTSVSGTSPIASSGGTTPTISIATGYTIPTSTEKGNYDTAYTGVNTATSANTANTIVKRGASGEFSAGAVSSTALNVGSGNSTWTIDDTTANVLTFKDGVNTRLEIKSGGLYVNGSTTALGSGTVTSVSGTSPIASSGGSTPAISLSANYGDTQNPYASKTAKYFLAAPVASAGAPTFRAIDASDIPTLNQNTTGSAGSVANSLVLKFDTGTTEGTNIYTFNGSGAKTIDFKSGTNVTLAETSGVVTFSSPSLGLGTTSGSGNAVTDISVSGHTVTMTKGSTFLTGNQTITLSGDVTGSGTTAITTTLKNSGVTAGSYTAPTISVDAQGRITSASSNTIPSVSSTPTDGATTTAISSDWAFDNVKTAVPASAVFTDTTTFSWGAGTATSGTDKISFLSKESTAITGAKYTTLVAGTNVTLTTNTAGQVSINSTSSGGGGPTETVIVGYPPSGDVYRIPFISTPSLEDSSSYIYNDSNINYDSSTQTFNVPYINAGLVNTVPIAKGGTNLTSVGVSGSILRSNGTAMSWSSEAFFKQYVGSGGTANADAIMSATGGGSHYFVIFYTLNSTTAHVSKTLTIQGSVDGSTWTTIGSAITVYGGFYLTLSNPTLGQVYYSGVNLVGSTGTGSPTSFVGGNTTSSYSYIRAYLGATGSPITIYKLNRT